mmetsp:Transcript_6261/g.15496  ORF Transcript_6261/g.15496 Transcript_6261/m.15496 type:complete len:639 (+) Transcript_6261:178-2094(+)|eukprot:CAMPEP_0197192850 /NCGR_PEP_ID=MMETSP1423-20130617/25864_1 /TAXON_ID=476441 /ORGANISM="Pseudo-nitzschia heimii, Strain UNC1101" /LENGTH=638 /DNA_ID=CAMNT_0042645837 /DNA_START=78 /DNA_END=1994 /DNA_ORIENTATION=-
MSSRSSKNTQLLAAGIVAAATIGLLFYFSSAPKTAPEKSNDDADPGNQQEEKDTKKPSSTSTSGKKSAQPADGTPKRSNVSDQKELHSKIEELDKKGKALFKNKKYLEAAATFTEALDSIESYTDDESESNSLTKQIVTLINNRSAMYEKGNLPELAVEDCNKILDVYDLTHTKARQRKLRILENKFKDYYQALVECCALQLQYMQQHKDQLRLGLPPSAPPPVQQEKLEELVQKIIPEQLEEYDKKIIQRIKENPQLPSDYTISQLLKSYTGYSDWTAIASSDGAVSELEKEVEDLLCKSMEDAAAIADVASLWLKIGRRHVFDGNYGLAREAILKGYTLVEDDVKIQSVMKDDDFARLLEWTGMVKHWAYELAAAIRCYKKCAELEPVNAEVIVKQAGVAMDAGSQEEALTLFDLALSIDPNAVDALLHRANLRMIQSNMDAAKTDLKRCIELRPDYVMARLRLAAVLTSTNGADSAKKQLEAAARIAPDSSDVLSYQGELLFTQNDFARAKEKFERAMKLEPKNPTPYVNTALAVLNTPPVPGKQLEMANEACELLEKAIEVDPQFQTAYVQLGQLKLGMATDLVTAREVVDMYDKGLSHCRTKEEMKDLMGMKLLTQAQVDGATALKMEAFSHQ